MPRSPDQATTFAGNWSNSSNNTSTPALSLSSHLLRRDPQSFIRLLQFSDELRRCSPDVLHFLQLPLEKRLPLAPGHWHLAKVTKHQLRLCKWLHLSFCAPGIPSFPSLEGLVPVVLAKCTTVSLYQEVFNRESGVRRLYLPFPHGDRVYMI
jgi:hypothetical protein